MYLYSDELSDFEGSTVLVSLGKNALFMSDIRGELPDCFELIGHQK